ncbi:MAG: HAD family hydrolase [Polyangiaceae bacterium]
MTGPSVPPKLLAVDLDGTLLDASGTPHARDLRALRSLRESGVPVSILTGRLYSGTRPTAEAIGIRGPVGCVDGSQLVDTSDHGTLVHHGITGSEASLLRDSLAEAKAATFVFAKDAIVHDDGGTPFLEYVRLWSKDVTHEPSVYGHGAWLDPSGVTAVVAVGSFEQISLVTNFVRASLGHALHVAMFPVRRAFTGFGLVVRAKTGTKGTALRWLAEHHGVSMAETVVVGDWLNDVPMFEVAGRAFAMGQAPDEVKAKATHVLTETSERGGGIARVVEEHFGITF